jgi:hypothetical protein
MSGMDLEQKTLLSIMILCVVILAGIAIVILYYPIYIQKLGEFVLNMFLKK